MPLHPERRSANLSFFSRVKLYDATTEFMARYESQFEALAEEAAQVALKNGVTTMFSSWGPLEVARSVRDRINRGDVVGSRIFFAGNIVGYTGPLGSDFMDASGYTSKSMIERINQAYEQGVGPELTFMTPDQVRESMRTYLAKGIDFIKYGASTHKGAPILFSPRVQRVIIEEARRAGKPVQVHSGSVESLHLAVELGVDYVQHCDFTGEVAIPEETLRLMASKKAICGPLAARSTHPIGELNQRNLVKTGVLVAMATDTGLFALESYIKEVYYFNEKTKEVPIQLGESHLRWLEVMQERGLTPMQNLQTATRNVALAYRKLDDLGTLEPGKLADILVLNANPLENVKNYGAVHQVIKDGREIDRSALPVNPILTKPRIMTKTR